ncbi:MAG: hypothetical protein KBG19_00375 [Bacteroidales bacterium]|jgi:hypothetical protein|nr:hypothetical protein [Bacteroidales bacterium]
MRKDQKKIVHDALINDEPVFVLRGKDSCALEALAAYYTACTKAGCSVKFQEEILECMDEFIMHKNEYGTTPPD